jgi:hypothetical protein
MAFCNSCGSAVEAGARFCPKCGAAAAPAAAPAIAVPSPAPSAAANVSPAKSSSALKIILIIVAVVVGLGILGVGTAAFLVHRVISRTHVQEKNGSVRVETPFGNVESTEDSDAAIQDLGIQVYPGATVIKGTTNSSSIGGMHTASADFESSDPGSSVAEFYKSKFPAASAMTSEGNHYSIVLGGRGNLTTISIEPREGKTVIHVAKLTGKANGGSVSTN